MPTYFYHGQPILAPFTILSNRKVFENETLSLKRIQLLTEAQRWELAFNVVLNSDESQVFIEHTWNNFATKTMIMPQLPGVYKNFSFTGTLVATSTAAAGQDTIVLTAAGGGASRTIPAGTFVKFAGHSKVYVTKTSLTFASGATSIQMKVFPNLVAAVPSAQAVQLDSNCVISYKLDTTSMQGITFSDGILSNPGTIRLIEQL